MKQIMIIAAALLILHTNAYVRAEDGGHAVASANVQSGENTVGKDAEATYASPYEEYRIGPHDLLEISVFQVTEISRTVRVNSCGVINLPLIGQVQAGGLTALELEESIAGKLAENYLQDPQVSVFIKEYVSQRVIVEGAVEKSGVYPLTGKTTLIQAIAMASGLDAMADESQVKIFRTRQDSGKKDMTVHDLRAIRAGKAEDPVIHGNDVIVVEKSGSRTAIKGIADTLRGFLTFGTLRP